MEVGPRSKVTLTPSYFKYKQSPPLTEQTYRDAIEAAASYNKIFCHDRKQRLPFLDSQTNLAQSHCNLWMPYRYRSKGVMAGQVYTYPARRWRKKKRAYSQVEVAKVGDIETGEGDIHSISAVENPAVSSNKHEPELHIGLSKDEATQEAYKMWAYDDYDVMGEPPDAGEIDDPNSDSSDYEETYIKKRKKKKNKGGGRGRGRGRAASSKIDIESLPEHEREKPYSCDRCGARYKTRPGLNYHLSHNHISSFGASDDLASQSPKPTPPPTPEKKQPAAPQEKDKSISANNYCDFCLGDSVENKKTGVKEELVSCADCGRSGHPTCLQFTDNMIISVKKYPWQCIECKSCGLCGTSDNDDQLLFCDDCDRGYHMYCLNPPLSEPPEGSWSCHLCIEEFHGGKIPDHMKQP